MRDRLNERYFNGRPSNMVELTGVLIHVLDGGVNTERPWMAGPRGFLSASLFNARKLPHGLYHGGVGLVISPWSQLRCSYPQECASSPPPTLTPPTKR